MGFGLHNGFGFSIIYYPRELEESLVINYIIIYNKLYNYYIINYIIIREYVIFELLGTALDSSRCRANSSC
jgi:hypothetical protein